MSARHYTGAEKHYLRVVYSERDNKLLAAELGRSIHSIEVCASKMGLRKSQAYFARCARRGKGWQGNPDWFTDEEVELLRELYPTTSTDEVARRLGRERQAVRGKAWRLGLVKVENAGGNPLNRYRNRTLVGTTRKSSGDYVRIKVAHTGNRAADWRPLHVVVWEQAYGPVPDGCVVTFKDGDRYNIAIANLELISRRDRFLRNSIHYMPQPLPARSDCSGGCGV